MSRASYSQKYMVANAGNHGMNMLRCYMTTVLLYSGIGAICFLMAGGVSAQGMYIEQGSELVYHAYFRKVDKADPGTAHLLIANTTTQPLSVNALSLNGYAMAETPNDWALWYQVVPATIEPGEIADAMIKLRWPTQKPVRISASLSNGQDISAVLDAVPAEMKFCFIGYSKANDSVYLYLQNMGTRELTITQVLSNTDDVTGSCFIPQRKIGPGEKVMVIFTPKASLRAGQYLGFKALTEQGETAVALSRVYSHFPVTALHGDSRSQLGFDRSPFEIKYPASPAAIRNYVDEPVFKAYHLLEDPACSDGLETRLVGSQAAEITSRSAACYAVDKVHPGFVYCCEHFKPYSYYVYGETTDIMVVCPYEMTYRGEQPLKNSEFVAKAKLASEPRLLWSIPEAFGERKPTRYPTPEEERIIVYSEIGEGSKGIWYCTDSPKYGYRNSPSLEAEIGRINRELQVLKDFLVIGEPVPLASANLEQVRTYSLLCGDKGIVLFLINTDHRSSYTAGEKPFDYVKTKAFQVRCRIPTGLKVTGVEDIQDGQRSPVKYEVAEGEIVIPITPLMVTRQMLISAQRL